MEIQDIHPSPHLLKLRQTLRGLALLAMVIVAAVVMLLLGVLPGVSAERLLGSIGAPTTAATAATASRDAVPIQVADATFVRQDVIRHDRIVAPPAIHGDPCGRDCTEAATAVWTRPVRERYWSRPKPVRRTAGVACTGTICTN